MSTLDEVHAYWKNRDAANRAEDFLAAPCRSELLGSIIARHARPEDSIFEIGCNCGRNLEYLWERGYRRLGGLDINSDAITMLVRRLPQLANCVTATSIENWVFFAAPVDVIFTMAVLEHVHPDSDWVFADIARLAGRVLITIEDEAGDDWRHFPRNYRTVFESCGLRQVEAFQVYLAGDRALDGFWARVFFKERIP